MKYSVGYRVEQNNDYIQAIIDRKEKVEEVYFSWGDFPNGRNSQIQQENFSPWEAQQKQIQDLKNLCSNGISLNLLFNGNCYGKDSQSRAFFEKVGQTVDYIQSNFLLNGITTTSPLIAKFVKTNFLSLDVRASVNMSIGTREGIDYISDCFDSFYLKRELNRDFSSIRMLKDYCDAKGKRLYALANSGCMNHCSAHTFHDNLVAHEQEIAAMDNGYHFEGVCRTYLKCQEHLPEMLSRMNFIRPEDTGLYEAYFPFLKLATRTNAHPIRVLRAYLDRGRYNGSVMNLLEPDNSGVIYPYILDNSRIVPTIKEEKLEYSGGLVRIPDDIAVLEEKHE